MDPVLLLFVLAAVICVLGLLSIFYKERAERSKPGPALTINSNLDFSGAREGFEEVTRQLRTLGSEVQQAGHLLGLKLEMELNHGEHHRALQLITLAAAILNAGDRAQGEAEQTSGEYAERAIELMIAAQEAIKRDKDVQDDGEDGPALVQ